MTVADTDGLPVTEDKVNVSDQAYTCSFGQTLVESIEWNGNRILFDYSPSDYRGLMTDRLTALRVVSSGGETLRTITFGNDSYWQSSKGSSKPEYGRRMLMSLYDSRDGRYLFEYDTHTCLPPVDNLLPASWSDLYGYFRGVSNTSVVTERVAEALGQVCPSIKGRVTPVADRSPVERAARNGMMTRLVSPTGCVTEFHYESNRYNGALCGGIRLASMAVADGDSRQTWSYAYLGTSTHENPEDLMWCDTYVGVDRAAAGPLFHHRRRAFSSPQFSPFQPSCPVAYRQVVETMPDGSSVTYDYHDLELSEFFGISPGLNPCLFGSSLIDTGNRMPLLVRRTTADAGGDAVLVETSGYDRNDLFRTFDTGVRTAYEFQSFDFHDGTGGAGLGTFSLYGGHFEMRRSTAHVRTATLREQGLNRFFLYDRARRQVVQGVSRDCNRNGAVNPATYTGGTSGFMSTGYTLSDESRIQQAELEVVSYHDDYAFVSTLDPRLASGTTNVSALGLATGSVTYNSDGGKSMSAMYYDIRGNVTMLREITDFGTLRVTDNTYTFTNQPLTTRMTEDNGMTVLTENTYDLNSALLLHTDVTVNGYKQRVSSVTYDDLGRVVSVTRGGKGGTVLYDHNLHGQTTSISGPGFAQTLHYTDGPGKPLYNGSVSAMSWTMGDHRERGYRYTYNPYGWLTLAEYGEGSPLSANRDRYTERFSGFMPNGGIRRLQRHGLKSVGNYGKIDNRTYHITGTG